MAVGLGEVASVKGEVDADRAGRYPFVKNQRCTHLGQPEMNEFHGKHTG